MGKIRGCLFALLSVILLVGCATPPVGESKGTLEYTDDLGRVVKLDKTPQRIISLAPSNTEFLFALGLTDRVVGVTDFDNYPPEAKQKPSIGGFSTPNIEKVVSLSPDLVLATSIHQKNVIPNLEQRGITVFALNPETLDEIMGTISLLGKLTGKEKEAASLVNGMQTKIKSITDKTGSLPESQKPRVLYLVWHDPLMSGGADTLHGQLIQQAGGINIARELAGYKSLSLESVVGANPEVIIAGVGMGEGKDLPLKFVLNEPRLSSTDARRHNRVYAIDTDLAGRAGPRIAEALEQFARAIHPELFK